MIGRGLTLIGACDNVIAGGIPVKMRRNKYMMVLAAFIAVFLYVGCDDGGDGDFEVFGGDSVAVTIDAQGVAVADGSVFKVYVQRHAAYFYAPEAVADGESDFAGGSAVATVGPALGDGLFYVYAYADVNPADGERPMPGDMLAGPVDLTVTGGKGALVLTAGDFLPVNVLARVDYSDPGGEGAEVRVKIGLNGTPCQATVNIEAYGVMEGGQALMGLAGVPDGNYSVCGVVDLDDGLSVTSLPGGTDLVAADGAGLAVVAGAGTAVLPEAGFHTVPEITLNLASAADGTQGIITIIDPVGMTPQAFGLADFTGGVASSPLVFWMLDGNYLAVTIVDLDGSGPMGVTLGDKFAAVMVNVAGAVVLPQIQDADFITVNVLATVEVSGHDGETVMLSVYDQGDNCAGAPTTVGLPLALADGSVTIPTGGLPDGNYEACVLVDADSSGGLSSGDLSAMHYFSVAGTAEFTVEEAEFVTIP